MDAFQDSLSTPSNSSGSGSGSPTFQNGDAKVAKCCNPTGCTFGDIYLDEQDDAAVRVICSNNECTAGNWMHALCFDAFEERALTSLRMNAKTRGWTEKQRQQAVWTKRGQDLCYRVCLCKCARGVLSKDTAYAPPKDEDETAKKQQRRQRRHQQNRQLPAIGQGRALSQSEWPPNGGGNGNNNVSQLSPNGFSRPRARTLSIGSVAAIKGTNNASLLAMIDGKNGDKSPRARHANHRNLRKGSSNSSDGFFDDTQVKSSGSIFKHRNDLSSFLQILPRWKVNGIHIKLEDDCPQGNDDARIFLLSKLGERNARQVTCLLCKCKLDVYDRYPLLDGTFFLSPVNHDDNAGYRVRFEGKESYLFACCMRCMEHEASGRRLQCKRCNGVGWFPGEHYTLGGLYTFDILSANPCCPRECNQCNSPILMCGQMRQAMQQGNISTFSEMVVCSSCGTRGPHLVRPIQDIRLIMADVVPTATRPLEGKKMTIDNYNCGALLFPSICSGKDDLRFAPRPRKHWDKWGTDERYNLTPDLRVNKLKSGTGGQTTGHVTLSVRSFFFWPVVCARLFF